MQHKNILWQYLQCGVLAVLLSTAQAFAAAPLEPVNLSIAVSAESNGHGAVEYSVRLSWEANDGGDEADGFRIYGRVADPDADNDFELLADTEANEHTFSGAELFAFFNSSLQRYEFTLRAYNADGESESTVYLVVALGSVYPPGQTDNEVFGFISTPPENGKVNEEYIYLPETNPDSDYFRYTLLEGPAGMTIDEETGEVRWTPDQPGVYTVTIQAHIGGMLPLTQTWMINVPVSAVISGVADNAAAAWRVRLYPNPAVDDAALSFTAGNGAARIVLLDALGRVVYQTTVRTQPGTDTYHLPLSRQAAGAYTVLIQQDAAQAAAPLHIVR